MSLTRTFFPDGLTPELIEAIEAEVKRDVAKGFTEPTTALLASMSSRQRLDTGADVADRHNVRTLHPRTTSTAIPNTEAEAA